MPSLSLHSWFFTSFHFVVPLSHPFCSHCWHPSCLFLPLFPLPYLKHPLLELSSISHHSSSSFYLPSFSLFCVSSIAAPSIAVVLSSQRCCPPTSSITFLPHLLPFRLPSLSFLNFSSPSIHLMILCLLSISLLPPVTFPPSFSSLPFSLLLSCPSLLFFPSSLLLLSSSFSSSFLLPHPLYFPFYFHFTTLISDSPSFLSLLILFSNYDLSSLFLPYISFYVFISYLPLLTLFPHPPPAARIQCKQMISCCPLIPTLWLNLSWSFWQLLFCSSWLIMSENFFSPLSFTSRRCCLWNPPLLLLPLHILWAYSFNKQRLFAQFTSVCAFSGHPVVIALAKQSDIIIFLQLWLV